ncbi:MAG TPA: 30S ribosomal protein S16 [Candidatus Goldiibacteriota bacterium]|nr:30S ribosomal protein S16 [Candidatus Goldiibacteriota bacterium]
MALIIRLKRMGRENTSFFRIVVADERKSAKGGPYIEGLGFYNPTKNPPVIKLDTEKANAWVAKGAKYSDTVKSIMRKLGAYKPVHAVKKKKKKAKKETK